MKTRFVIFSFLLFSFLTGCSGSGGGSPFSPDKGGNLFGFSFTTYTSSSNAILSSDYRAVAYPPSAGSTYYAGSADGLFSINVSTEPPTFLKIADAGLTNQSINSLLFETSGNLLIGTDYGLFRRNATTGAIQEVAGLETKRILSLALQSDGVIWAGLEDKTSNTRSIAKSSTGGFTFMGKAEGMTASSVVNIFVDEDGIMACGIGGTDGLFEATVVSSGTNKFSLVSGTPLTAGATCFFRTSTAWYLGAPGQGVFSTSNSGPSRKWTQILKDVTPNVMFQQKYNDQEYRYWVGTDKGLVLSYDATTWHWFDKTNGLTLENCKGLFTTSEVWIAHPGPTGGITRGIFTGN